MTETDRHTLARQMMDTCCNTRHQRNTIITVISGNNNNNNNNDKKALRETQTLRAGCSKVEPKKFRPAADPLPGGAGWPKFNQLEMVTTFT